MKNFVQKGDAITVAAPSGGVDSGDPVLIGTHLFGVAAITAAVGAPVALSTRGVFTLPKVSIDVFARGAPVYFDASAGLMTTDDDSSANPQVGVAVKAAGNPSATVAVALVPVTYLPPVA